MTLVRVRSHRAREQMKRALGRLPTGYFSFWQSGEFRLVADDELPKLVGIKGITKARVDAATLQPYLS